MLLKKVLLSILGDQRIELVRLETSFIFSVDLRYGHVCVAAKVGGFNLDLTEQQMDSLLYQILENFPGVIHKAENGQAGRIVISAPRETIIVRLYPNILSAMMRREPA